jgi:hypothetical protein
MIHSEQTAANDPVAITAEINFDVIITKDSRVNQVITIAVTKP